MKSMMKKAASLLLAVLILITALPVMAKASDTDISISPKTTLTLHTAKTLKRKQNYRKDYAVGWVGNHKAKATSSKPKIATVKITDGFVMVTPKKAGKTTLTITVDKKKYTCKLTVSKYTNPISSVKIGKTTIAGKKFNKQAYATLKYSKFAKKNTAVKFKLKKGWKITGIYYAQKNWEDAPEITAKKSALVQGGAGFCFFCSAYNSKLGKGEWITVVLQ